MSSRRLDVEMRAMPSKIARATIVRHAIDMAGDDMAAELVADFERAFEIEPRARTPLAGGRARQRFGRGIDVERGAIARLPDRDRGQAGPAQAIEAPIAIVSAG